MRPVVALFVGIRGIPMADLCRPLANWADVVVVTAGDILAQRYDSGTLPSLPAFDVVVAVDTAQLVPTAVEYARTHRVNGAFTVSEDAIEATASFAERMQLLGQPPATMPGFRDKFEQRRLLAEAGVPVPAYAELRGADPAEIEQALACVPLPAILKPTRGSGGVLAYVVSEADQLRELLAEATKQRPSAGGAVDADSAFILESLLAGVESHPVAGLAPYVSVETLAAAGEYHHLAVTDRFPVSPPALETGMLLPSCLSDPQQEQVRELAGAALRALGFEHGVAHTEIMLTADGPRIIEVNARVGGALPYLFPMASDLDLVEQAARVAVGLEPRTSVTFRGHSAFIAPQHAVGARVESVDGLDDVATLPGVRAVLPVAVGGSAAAFNATMIAAVLATVPDGLKAVRLWRAVMRRVRPRYTSAELSKHHLRAPAALTGHAGVGVVEAVPHVLKV
jgi:biotin carboxylase